MKVTSANTQVQLNNPNVSAKDAVSNMHRGHSSSQSFMERLENGLEQVATTQSNAANLARNYELGLENDLAKVMVGQQVSSLAFQLTLNVRNKALSAYKDIMNMPV
jgi:flagellar hook-basal body complex protein FliE